MTYTATIHVKPEATWPDESPLVLSDQPNDGAETLKTVLTVLLAGHGIEVAAVNPETS